MSDGRQDGLAGRIQILLEDVSLVVDLAEDGLVAIEKARTGQYNLILMDMQMPVLDGLDATREIRKLPGCKKTPVVAMTANDLPRTGISASMLGWMISLPSLLGRSFFMQPC